MEGDPFEMDQGVNLGSLPSDAEMNKLLQDSPIPPKGSPLTDHEDSPTAAIKTALEARVMEEGEESIIAIFKPPLPLNTDDCGGIEPSNGRNVTCVGIGGSVHAAAEGGAVGSSDSMHADSAQNKTKTIKSTPKIPEGDATQILDGKTRDSYADRAKKLTRPEEQAKYILHIYSTKDRKNPLSLEDWNRVDEQLILGLVDHPEPVQIASSSYNSKHWFGFVACMDIESQNWVKKLVLGMRGNNLGYRAWSRDEKPLLPVCRLFLPSRFDGLDETIILKQLLKYNPSLQVGSVNLKESEVVQGGRALYLEMTLNAYEYVKSRDHRLCFLATYVDCQLRTQPGPKRKVGLGSTIEGIQRLNSDPRLSFKPPNSSVTASQPKNQRLEPGRGVLDNPPATPKSTPINPQAPAVLEVQEGEGKRRRRNRGGRSRKRNSTPETQTNTNLNSNNNTQINIAISPNTKN